LRVTPQKRIVRLSRHNTDIAIHCYSGQAERQQQAGGLPISR
jgi:hypothetical protein